MRVVKTFELYDIILYFFMNSNTSPPYSYPSSNIDPTPPFSELLQPNRNLPSDVNPSSDL
jgi:hypothetical protein